MKSSSRPRSRVSVASLPGGRRRPPAQRKSTRRSPAVSHVPHQERAQGTGRTSHQPPTPGKGEFAAVYSSIEAVGRAAGCGTV